MPGQLSLGAQTEWRNPLFESSSPLDLQQTDSQYCKGHVEPAVEFRDIGDIVRSLGKVHAVKVAPTAQPSNNPVLRIRYKNTGQGSQVQDSAICLPDGAVIPAINNTLAQSGLSHPSSPEPAPWYADAQQNDQQFPELAYLTPRRRKPQHQGTPPTRAPRRSSSSFRERLRALAASAANTLGLTPRRSSDAALYSDDDEQVRTPCFNIRRSGSSTGGANTTPFSWRRSSLQAENSLGTPGSGTPRRPNSGDVPPRASDPGSLARHAAGGASPMPPLPPPRGPSKRSTVSSDTTWGAFSIPDHFDHNARTSDGGASKVTAASSPFRDPYAEPPSVCTGPMGQPKVVYEMRKLGSSSGVENTGEPSSPAKSRSGKQGSSTIASRSAADQEILISGKSVLPPSSHSTSPPLISARGLAPPRSRDTPKEPPIACECSSVNGQGSNGENGSAPGDIPSLNAQSRLHSGACSNSGRLSPCDSLSGSIPLDNEDEVVENQTELLRKAYASEMSLAGPSASLSFAHTAQLRRAYGSDMSMMGRQPSLMGQQPSLMGRQPSLMGQQPSLMGQHTSLMGQQPSLMSQQPSLMEQQPSLMRGEYVSQFSQMGGPLFRKKGVKKGKVGQVSSFSGALHAFSGAPGTKRGPLGRARKPPGPAVHQLPTVPAEPDSCSISLHESGSVSGASGQQQRAAAGDTTGPDPVAQTALLPSYVTGYSVKPPGSVSEPLKRQQQQRRAAWSQAHAKGMWHGRTQADFDQLNKDWQDMKRSMGATPRRSKSPAPVQARWRPPPGESGVLGAESSALGIYGDSGGVGISGMLDVGRGGASSGALQWTIPVERAGGPARKPKLSSGHSGETRGPAKDSQWSQLLHSANDQRGQARSKSLEALGEQGVSQKLQQKLVPAAKEKRVSRASSGNLSGSIRGGAARGASVSRGRVDPRTQPFRPSDGSDKIEEGHSGASHNTMRLQDFRGVLGQQKKGAIAEGPVATGAEAPAAKGRKSLGPVSADAKLAAARRMSDTDVRGANTATRRVGRDPRPRPVMKPSSPRASTRSGAGGSGFLSRHTGDSLKQSGAACKPAQVLARTRPGGRVPSGPLTGPAATTRVRHPSFGPNRGLKGGLGDSPKRTGVAGGPQTQPTRGPRGASLSAMRVRISDSVGKGGPTEGFEHAGVARGSRGEGPRSTTAMHPAKKNVWR